MRGVLSGESDHKVGIRAVRVPGKNREGAPKDANAAKENESGKHRRSVNDASAKNASVAKKNESGKRKQSVNDASTKNIKLGSDKRRRGKRM